MKQNQNRGNLIIRLLMILIGNAMYAAAVVLFIMPNGLITGGTTGLGLFINRTIGIPVSAFVSLFNISMFGIGAWILGKEFAMTTALSTVFYPLILGILESSGVPGFVTEEGLVAVLYGGMLIGGGIGLVMRAGASTGGMDIPALVLKKQLGVNVSLSIYLMDCVILGLQLIEAEPMAVLYGILLIIVYTLVLDKVLVAGNARIQVKIISSRYREINALLGERLDCGTSLIHMETGYLHNQQDMIVAVISKRDLPRLNSLVLREDSEAFIIINQINEVKGRGFTLGKVYREQ